MRFAGLRTVAFDGCNSVKIPDTDRNQSWIGKIRYRMGLAGYPTLRLMALAETGTRGLPGATVGSAADRDEATLARRLLHLLGPGMLVLLDRAFDASAFLAEVHATGAMLLARAKSTRNPPVLEHLPDGSYLSRLDDLPVRMIDARVAMTGADGSCVADRYRLITTLTDHRAFPAAALVRLYHERWEIESAFLALRHTLLNGRVLRSGDRPGVDRNYGPCSAWSPTAESPPTCCGTCSLTRRCPLACWRLVSRRAPSPRSTTSRSSRSPPPGTWHEEVLMPSALSPALSFEGN